MPNITSIGSFPIFSVSAGEDDQSIKTKLDHLRRQYAEITDRSVKLEIAKLIVDLESELMKNNAAYWAPRDQARFKNDIDKITELKKKFIEKCLSEEPFSDKLFEELRKIRETYEEIESYWGIKNEMVALPPSEIE